MKWFIFFVACFAFLLTGCMQQPTSVPLTQSWAQRQHTLSLLLNWQFRGHFVFKSPADKFSANVFWQQNHDRYDIQVFGPFGIGAVQLQGNSTRVTLKDAHAHTYTADDPEQLMQQQLGWFLPVSSLYYWVRGLPAPGSITSVHYDAFHRIETLAQQGWKIQFIHYTRVQAVELPQEIVFTHGQDYLHLIIEPGSWLIN